MQPLKLCLLGTPEISILNQPSPTFKTAKAEGLLYYLAATQRMHTRAVLATLFWGDMAEGKARVNLSKALSELREQVGDYVTITTQTVMFNAALPYQLDIETLLKPLADGALTALQAEVDQYRGDFLEGFQVRNAPDFERWLLAERERIRSAVVQRLEILAGRYEQTNNTTNAIATLRRLLQLEPWREAAHMHLMKLLVHTGEPQAALRQYEVCRLALRDELAVEPSTAITQLYQAIRANGKGARSRERPAPSPPQDRIGLRVAAPTQPPYHLPQPPTEFVGREAEISALVARLQEPACRLITLVGPGGIGKTRLASEVARKFLTREATGLFPAGIFFVDLLPVDSAAGMISAIAAAIGFTFYSSTPPQQQLFNYLKARKLLLLLDNFEHLCPESSLVAELLVAAPGLKVLVTSRDALPLQSAYLHLVQGLDYAADQPTADTTATDAVCLFVQRAQRHQATFSLTQNLASVTQICRTVGGLPLALELAATWLRTLSCTQIAQELEKGAALLSANLLDIPERHRDMRIVFEQSWQRLTPSEATVMSALAIFRGGFTLATAEQVVHASIQTLAALVEKALIRLDESGRYQLHELLRQFAHDKLSVGKVQANGVAAAHAKFFLTLAAQLQTHLTDHCQQAALTSLQADIDNLRTAWFWALQQPDQPDIAEAIDSLYLFFLFTCRYSEGKELFIASADLLGSLSDVASLMTTRAAVFAYHLGEYEQPTYHFHALLASPSDQPQRDIAIAYSILGQIAGWQGRNAQAEHYLQQAVDLYAALGDQSRLASVLHNMAEMYAHAPDYRKAFKSAQTCLDIGLQLRRNDLIGSANYTLGYAYKSLGRPKLALYHYQQGCIYTEKAGDRLGYALSVGGVGDQLCQLGHKQWAQGFALVQQSLAICRELGHFVHIVTRLFTAAEACINGRRYAEAIHFAEEFIQVATAGNFQRAISVGLFTLGESYYAMGDLAMSRLYLQQAIKSGIEHNSSHFTHFVICYARLLEKEADQLADKTFTSSRLAAVALATGALCRPGWYTYHRQADQLLERQKACLTLDQFASAQVLAQGQTLEALATQILNLDHEKVIG